jgi:hypothetical protein
VHAQAVERCFVAPVARDDCAGPADSLRDIHTVLREEIG